MKAFVRFSVEHPVTTVMMAAALVLLGILGTMRMETALLPEISFPQLTVVTVLQDESPDGIEKRVTKPVEEALSGLRGLVSYTASSSQGISVVRVVLDWKADIQYAAMEAREKLDLARNALPQDAERPVVLQYDPNAAPLLSIACVGKAAGDKDLRSFLEKDVKPLLQRIDGVGGVKLTGGEIPEVCVDVDPARLSSVSLSLQDIVQIISSANQNIPAGPLPEGDREVMVRTVGEFERISEIEDIRVLPDKDSAPIRLGMLATVSSGWKEKRSETLYGMQPCVGISIYNDSTANQVATAQRVRETLARIGEKYAQRFTSTVVVDRSTFISDAVLDVTVSSVLGGVLAFLVLLVFLKRLPESIILALSIPVCVAATLFLMYLAGITLNVISLGGLALGIGMTVDSGIVVAESIRKRQEAGERGITAVIEGTAEVATPVFASIWTTIVVFVPILFVSGLSGRLFGQMALTVSFSLLVSIFTALSLIPMLLAQVAARETKQRGSRRVRPASHSVHLLVVWERCVRATMTKKRTVFVSACVAFLVAIPFFLLLDRGFLPDGQRNIITAQIRYPSDLPFEDAEHATTSFIRKVLSSLPGATVFTEIGVDESDPTSAATDRDPATAYLSISVPESLKPDEAVQKVRRIVHEGYRYPVTVEADTTLIEGIASSGGAQRTIRILGEEDLVEKAGPVLHQTLATNKLLGIARVSMEGNEKREELRVVTDRAKAASLGVDVQTIAATIRAAIAGDIATEFRRGDRQLAVRVRFARKYRESTQALSRIRLRTASGELVPLSYVCSFDQGSTGSRLFRKNGKRTYALHCTLSDQGQPMSGIYNALHRFQEQHHVTVNVEGTEEMDENLSGLFFAFLLAVILVYMVMASQFEHVTMPLVVLVSLPLSFVGSFALMVFTGTSLNTISTMGMIMLAGIAVNNAIVLYDRFKHNMGQGMKPDEAATEAAVSRTRPIMMTTATAFMGFLPLVLIGASLQRDLAMAALGGLATSHGLTLLLLPVFFAVFGKRIR